MSCSRRIVECAKTILALAVLVSLIDYSEAFDHGEWCDHDYDCNDVRLVCLLSNNTCECSRFYDWVSEIKRCVLNTTTFKMFLSSLDEDVDYREELNVKDSVTFKRIEYAGILALSLGILGGISCVFVFCIIDRKSNYSKTLMNKPTNEGVRPQAAAQIDTIIPGTNDIPLVLPMVMDCV